MYLKISQKYFSIGDKFNLVDENDNARFLASEKIFTLRKNAHLYSLDGMEICRFQSRILRVLPYYDLFQGETVIGFIKRRFEMIPFVNVWNMEFNGKQYALRSAGYNCKICPAEGKKFKHDRKNPIATVSKKLIKIKDTYVVDFDPNVLDPTVAAVIGLWMDAAYHKDQH